MGDSVTVLLGKEHDKPLGKAVVAVLRGIGAIRLASEWGMYGSQEITTETWGVGETRLILERETYMGLTLSGPVAVVTRIYTMLLNRVQTRLAKQNGDLEVDVVVKVFLRDDGMRRVVISVRGGLYRFGEDELAYADYEFLDLERFPYWSPLDGGGLYQSAEVAEAEARAIIPWLRDAETKV